MKRSDISKEIKPSLSEEDLLALVPGFTNGYAVVNGIKLHYVIGGKGEPLLLIPGWPQTWWCYHKIMPTLAHEYQVIVVDIRGMGSSDKPREGYTKKNMATDIRGLVSQLGLEKVSIAGHDIGATIAFSYAANFPQHTHKLILFDTPHPDENVYKLPMLPVGSPVYPWWVAFNQVKELPEALLEGRYRMLLDWLFDQLLLNQEAISSFDRQVYEEAYNTKEAIRASNAWYQAFTQDIEDIKSYPKISLPVLGLGSKSGYEMLQYALPPYTEQAQLREIAGAGHFIQEEKPHETVQAMIDFLKS